VRSSGREREMGELKCPKEAKMKRDALGLIHIFERGLRLREESLDHLPRELVFTLLIQL
jgi:hypothetical protein